MTSSKAAIIIITLVVCLASGVVGSQIDGRPRPANFPDTPTEVYGPDPVLTDQTSGSPIDCSWYGWANTMISASDGASCLLILHKALTNETVNPPSKLVPYRYYTLKRLFDTATNQSYCYIGCFKLDDAAPTPVPSVGSPPPMVDSPPVSAIAPSTPAPTPSGMIPTTPETVSPSPSSNGLPPGGIDSPNSGEGPAGSPLSSPSSSAVYSHPSRLFSIVFLGAVLILSVL